jgi:hypothetical protein
MFFPLEHAGELRVIVLIYRKEQSNYMPTRRLGLVLLFMHLDMILLLE